MLPIAEVATLYLGASKGCFKEEQLTIEPQVMQGGAELTAAVGSGDVALGFAATEPLIVAKSKMTSALEAGRVDATTSVEPFVSGGQVDRFAQPGLLPDGPRAVLRRHALHWRERGRRGALARAMNRSLS